MEEFTIYDHNIDYCLYIKKDYAQALNLFHAKFTEFLNKTKEKIKHKCNRNDTCPCIQLGEYLCEIYINLFNGKVKFNNLDFLQTIEKYFTNPNINIPVPLLITISKTLIKMMDFQNCRILLETYLTYSALNNKSEGMFKSAFIINQTDYEQLYHILMFDVVLLLDGFNKTRTKILSIGNSEIKERFLNQIDLLCIEYSKKFNSELKELEDKELAEKLNKLIEERNNFSFGNKKFSAFLIKGSLIQKLYSLLLNKKFLSVSTGIMMLYVIIWILKRTKLDTKIMVTLIKLFNMARNVKIIREMFNLLYSIFNLLINY